MSDWGMWRLKAADVISPRSIPTDEAESRADSLVAELAPQRRSPDRISGTYEQGWVFYWFVKTPSSYTCLEVFGDGSGTVAWSTGLTGDTADVDRGDWSGVLRMLAWADSNSGATGSTLTGGEIDAALAVGASERRREEAMVSAAPAPSVAEQPDPSGDGRPIWPLVIADMEARDAVGRERYGTPLLAHNGRDALVDAYQEALDLAVYLRQEIEERGNVVRRTSPLRSWEVIAADVPVLQVAPPELEDATQAAIAESRKDWRKVKAVGIHAALHDVLEFHTAMLKAYPEGAECKGRPGMTRRLQRLDWIAREDKELRDSVDEGDTVNAIRELIDGIYLRLGTLVMWCGVERAQACWDAVHQANMAKRDEHGVIHTHPDGKIAKPPGWVPPDLASILGA